MALHFLSPSSVDFAKQIAARFDVIIIGAGSTGSVMAARLSENPNCRVLLVEAGPAQLNAEMLAATQNANQPAVLHGLNWKIRTQIKAPANSVPHIAGAPSRSVASIFDYEAGKVLGGSSAVNATQALRGCPSDYDEWIAECGEEWGWKAVLPFFRRLENDTLAHTDGEDANALHGHDGPFPIRREGQQELTPLQEGLRLACLSKGFSETHDHNNPATTGVGIIPKNVINGIRMSVAQTYLALAVDRTNLFIITEATAHRLHWTSHDSTQCDGVELEIDAAMHTVLADKVIVCAGVMQTPGLLTRSGIGAPPLLQKLDISVRSPLIGVGENFMEHPVVGIWGIPKEGESRLGEPLRQTLLRYSSGHSTHQNDMHICMMAGIDVAAMFPHLASEAKTIAGLTACFNKSKSRGYVRITSADAHAKPLVVNNCLGDASDITPLKHGVRLAWDLLQTPALAGKFEKILAWTEGMIKSDIALERAVTTFVRPAAHGCGSAKMGLHPDHGAVLDPQGRVYGIQNLWVADASAIPLIPSAPPHLTALMLAEKLAHQFCKVFR